MKNPTGLPVNVYRTTHGGPTYQDTTNGGISATHDVLTLIPADGPFTPSQDHPAVTLIRREIMGSIYTHLQPCDETGAPLPGWYMFGGNFAYTSDSRFPSKQPIPIHDRQEPWKE